MYNNTLVIVLLRLGEIYNFLHIHKKTTQKNKQNRSIKIQIYNNNNIKNKLKKALQTWSKSLLRITFPATSKKLYSKHPLMAKHKYILAGLSQLILQYCAIIVLYESIHCWSICKQCSNIWVGSYVWQLHKVKLQKTNLLGPCESTNSSTTTGRKWKGVT